MRWVLASLLLLSTFGNAFAYEMPEDTPTMRDLIEAEGDKFVEIRGYLIGWMHSNNFRCGAEWIAPEDSPDLPVRLAVSMFAGFVKKWHNRGVLPEDALDEPAFMWMHITLVNWGWKAGECTR